MSATGRGPRRGGPDDCFATPRWPVHRLLEAWAPRPGRLFEPAAGEGALIASVDAKLGRRDWAAVECRATAANVCAHVTGVRPFVADFLSWEPAEGAMDDVSTVITNPPFHRAEDFIRHADELCPTADLVFLIRLGFLASKKRLGLWRDVGLPDVYVLPNRPSFTDDGLTDASDYAWIVVPAAGVERLCGTFRVLGETPARDRRPARPTRRAA